MNNTGGSSTYGVAGFGSVQSLAQNAGSVALGSNSSVALVKLSTGVAFGSNIASTFASAIGSSALTNTSFGNYLVMAYDTTHSKALLAVVNSSANNGGTLNAADFTASTVSVVGVLDMNATDYAAFNSSNFGLY